VSDIATDPCECSFAAPVPTADCGGLDNIAAETSQIVDTRFQPGAAWRGNKHGRPRKPPLPDSIRELARDHAVEAVEVLVHVLNDPTASARDRVSAANSILDRAFGKPTAHAEAAVTSRFELMSEKELIDYLTSGADYSGGER
jgi:hypothetical protein